MRRTFRWLCILLFTAAGAAAATAWARSYSTSDTLWYDTSTYGGAVMSHRGQVAVGGSPRLTQIAGPIEFEYHPWETERIDREWPFKHSTNERRAAAGFAIAWNIVQGAGPGEAWRVEVPSWFLMLVTLGPAVLLWRRDRRLARRRIEGCCRKCGYDLRASEGRCPECGTEFTPSAPAPQPLAPGVAFPNPRS